MKVCNSSLGVWRRALVVTATSLALGCLGQLAQAQGWTLREDRVHAVVSTTGTTAGRAFFGHASVNTSGNVNPAQSGTASSTSTWYLEYTGTLPMPEVIIQTSISGGGAAQGTSNPSGSSDINGDAGGLHLTMPPVRDVTYNSQTTFDSPDTLSATIQVRLSNVNLGTAAGNVILRL